MAVGTSPSSLQAHLGYWLRTVSNAVSQSFARQVESMGVTVAEWVFLRMLYDIDEIAPSALAERMGFTKGAISKLADRLVSKDLVKRNANSADKRGHVLALTPKGRKLVPRLAELADRNDAAFFNVLDKSERRQLERILTKIAAERELTSIPID